MNAPNLSILGLGRMGEPIARRLLAALGALTVWNRTAAKSAALGQAGARVAAVPADAAAGVQRPVLVVHGTVSPVGETDKACSQLQLLGGGLADSEVLRQKRDRGLSRDFDGAVQDGEGELDHSGVELSIARRAAHR